MNKIDLSTAIKIQDLEDSKFDVLYRWLYDVDGLSDGAILLYTMARNVWELSKNNNWVDEEGNIFFYFSRSAIQEKRKGWSLDKISRIIKELEYKKLLIVDRSDAGGANKYYLEGSVEKIINFNKKDTQSQNKTSLKISLPQSDFKTTQSQNKSTQSYFKTLMNNTNETYKRDLMNEPKKTTKKEIPLPEFLDPKLWEDYLAYKKERKEKLSNKGIKMKFSEWEKWHNEGIDVNQCIRQAMANEWQGVFKPKKGEQENRHNLSQGTLNTIQQMKELMQEMEAKGYDTGRI